MTTKNRSIGTLLTTSNQDVYVVPNSYRSEVGSILINNSTSATVTLTLEWLDVASGVYTKIASTTPIYPNSMVQVTSPLHLTAGDKIRALASANSAISVTVDVSELYVPTII
jgi:hypothetical protein